MKSKLSVFSLMLASLVAVCGQSAQALSISGLDIVSAKTVSVSLAEKSKGTVLVFLSAVCPCSFSHLAELRALAADFPDYTFVGVHSNTDEKKVPTTEYFKAAALPFPVIQDHESKLADEYKALKTPHAFVLGLDGKILYQGGVSSSRDFSRADKKFLRLALSDLQAGRKVAIAEGRTLGCVIKRGDKNEW